MTHTISVTATVQGGHRREGTAIGRKGRKLLVRYLIQSGETRERWLPPSRYELPEWCRSIEILPRYVDKICPAVKFDEPVLVAHDTPTDQHNQTIHELRKCSVCGRDHHLNRIYEKVEGSWWNRNKRYTGRKSLKLGEEVSS